MILIKTSYKFLLFSFFLLFIFGIFNYKGSLLVYIFFSLISFFLLFYSINKNFSFFEFFFSFFLFLGFWFNFTFKISFFNSKFLEGVGKFDYSAKSYDSVLLICSFAFLGIILAIFFRRYIFPKSKNLSITQYPSKLLIFYKQNTKKIFYLILFLITLISFLNYYFSIYQRGVATKIQYILFYYFFSWLLSFGMCSICALFVDLEIKSEKSRFGKFIYLSLYENCISAISMLSRGMIVNSFSIYIGIYKSLKISGIHKFLFFFYYLMILVFLFLILFIFVGYLRNEHAPVFLISNTEISYFNLMLREKFEYFQTFFSIRLNALISRLIGIEGVMAVYSFENNGFDLLKKAILINDINHLVNYKASFFDFLKGVTYNNSSQISITVPGIIGFLFYSGSIIFVAITLFIITFLFSFVELVITRILWNNYILCSLFSSTIAYRLWHFGFDPSGSWKLLLAIFFNIIIINLFVRAMTKLVK